MCSFPVGKVKLLNMYPMDFEEFLLALNKDMLVKEIRECYLKNKKMYDSVHNMVMRLYKSYLIIGGMPRSVDNFVKVEQDFINVDSSILNDIKLEYFDDIKKYVDSKREALKIKETYRSIPMQLANEANKFQYSKVKSGGRASDYDTVLDWLIDANLVNISFRVSVPEIPLEGFVNKDIFKLFISDVGILNSMLGVKALDILNDNLSLYKGAIAENYVANALISNGYKLYYWQSNGRAEIDFLLYTDNGIIPIEVKAAGNTQSKSLKVYMEKFNPKYAIRISSKNFGYNNDTRIKSIPLYAVFCLND